MKHTRYFNEFLAEEVNLNQSRIDRLNTSVSAVGRYLSRNLESYDGVERQGSYALRTIIKPVKENQEYDADVLVLMEHDSDAEPSEYIDNLYRCFLDSDVYREKAHRKTRCVVLDYAGDFHLDLVPCIVVDEAYYICNKKTNEFEETDGTGYRDWFNGKNGHTYGNLKRVARLLKYLRDHKSNFTAKSILLTTLIGNAVEDWEEECFKSLPDALKTVSNRMNAFLQDHPVIPNIYNPALPEEDFTRHWDQAKYSNFRDLFDKYNEKIDDAFDCVCHDDSVEKWRGIFGDRFGKIDGDDGKDRSSQAAVVSVTPVKPWRA